MSSDDPFDFLNSIGEVDTDISFKPMPNGIYPHRVEKAVLKRNKRDSGSYINIQWRCIDPEYEGRVNFTMHSVPVAPGSTDWEKQVQEKGSAKKVEEAQEFVIKKFFSDLEAITGQDWGNPATRPKVDLKKLVGMPSNLTLIEDEYEGKPKNTVVSINPIDSDSGTSAAVGSAKRTL